LIQSIIERGTTFVNNSDKDATVNSFIQIFAQGTQWSQQNVLHCPLDLLRSVTDPSCHSQHGDNNYFRHLTSISTNYLAVFLNSLENNAMR